MRDSNFFRPDSQKPSWCKLRKFCWLWSCCGCLPWCCFFFIKTRPTSVTSASNRQKQFYKWHQMSSSPLRNRTRCTFNTAMPIRLKCNKYYWTVVQLFGKHTHIYSNAFALRPRQEQCVKQTDRLEIAKVNIKVTDGIWKIWTTKRGSVWHK